MTGGLRRINGGSKSAPDLRRRHRQAAQHEPTKRTRAESVRIRQLLDRQASRTLALLRIPQPAHAAGIASVGRLVAALAAKRAASRRTAQALGPARRHTPRRAASRTQAAPGEACEHVSVAVNPGPGHASFYAPTCPCELETATPSSAPPAFGQRRAVPTRRRRFSDTRPAAEAPSAACDGSAGAPCLTHLCAAASLREQLQRKSTLGGAAGAAACSLRVRAGRVTGMHAVQ